MIDKSDKSLNVLSFHLSPGPYTCASIFIDGKNFLEEFDLSGEYIPLSAYDLADPILALDDISLLCESAVLKCFNLASCRCGFTGCSAVVCDITLEFGEMIWSNFLTSGPEALPHIGPFRFDLEQVSTDLKAARKQHQSTLN
ncbi:hypothetical protein PUV54_11490 [Hyphococcus flavus]|uniref:Uncharacterized protein n=1 Tax=Hyphococcus flavus TaxID=1866326 RepID=A0AAE9ZCR2_9PROT|nr:hypothetical protein [Hyphococcus flavus]WDI30577.1 hypothetical protein PUV54_11490 [Hyphococcus flavus]